MAAFGQLMMNEGYRRLSVAVGSSLQMTWPLAAAVGGFWIFGEVLTPIQLLGAGLILFGAYRVRMKA